jgi:hypothetical protein
MFHDIVSLLNAIPELALMLILGFGGYKLYLAYSKTANIGQSLDQVVDEFSDAAKQIVGDSKEALADFAESVAPEVNYSFDVTQLSTSITGSAMLKAVNFSSRQSLTVKQTGNREVNLFGVTFDVPLEGWAGFDYSIGWTGDVDFNVDGLQVQQLDNVIQLTLPVPEIFVSEVKFAVAQSSGNLSKLELARRKGQEALDKVDNYPFFFSLYFMAKTHGVVFLDQLMEQANDEVERKCKALVTKFMTALKPGVSYEVFVDFSGTPDKVNVFNGHGGTYPITFDAIKASSIQNIIEDFGDNSNTTIDVQKLEGTIEPITASNTISVS